MIHVLILEDNLRSLDALSVILKSYSRELCVHPASTYKEAKDLLDGDIQFGLFLLDVNLSGEDKEDIGGIVFAREVREKFLYSFTPIVMITAIGAHEMQAYRELHCYQYIMKPYTKEQVEAVLEKVLQKDNLEKPHTVNIKKDGINYQIRCDEILYIEAIPRGVCIHMKKEDWNLPYVSLKQIMEKLPDEFLQCHRVYVVNKNEIEYTDLVNRMIKLRGVTPMIEIGVTYKGKIGKVVK